MKKTLAALACGLLLACGTAMAQNTVDAQQQSNSTAQNSGVSNTTTVNSYGTDKLDYHTNQASTAPAVIGGAFGCIAIDGVTGSVVVANMGKTNAREMPGCMLNQLAILADGLRKEKNPEGTWQWTGASLIKLEAWCGFEPYKDALESSGQYVCRKTLDQRALQATVLAAPQPEYTDPHTRARLGLPPLK